MVYDPEQNYIYKIFNKKTFRWELIEFESEPGVQTHLINAYEPTPGVIKIDTLLAGNGEAMSLMMFENMNATGQDLADLFEKMAPIGTTTQVKSNPHKSIFNFHLRKYKLVFSMNWTCQNSILTFIKIKCFQVLRCFHPTHSVQYPFSYV